MKVKFQGNARVKYPHLQRLRRTFETLEMKASELVNDYFRRVIETANDMRNYRDDMDDVKIVEKILRSLTDNFNFVVCSIEESKHIDLLTVDKLQSSLFIHEQKIRERRSEEQVLQVEQDTRKGTRKGRHNYQRERGSYTRGHGRGKSFVNRNAIICFQCQKQGHYQFECPNLEKEANFAEFEEEEELLLMAHAEIQHTKDNEIWFLDSGCSNHITGNKSWFIELDESFRHTVRLGNNTTMSVLWKGRVKFIVEGLTQIVSDVYFVPDLTNNLLSIGQLQEKNLVTTIKAGACHIYHPQKGKIVDAKMTTN